MAEEYVSFEFEISMGAYENARGVLTVKARIFTVLVLEGR